MEPKEIKITGPQKNSVRIVLLILNRSVDEIEDLCRCNGKNSILYKLENDLNEQERKEIRKKIAHIKRYIAYLTKQFNFEKESKGIKRTISSHIDSLWEIICGIESKRLKGYGEVDISLKEYLDPVINKLIQLLGETSDVLYKKEKLK